jgi:hypothetical protein
MSAQDELPPRWKWLAALRRAELEAELAKVTVERDEARRMAEIRLRAIESIRHALHATLTEGA